MFNVDFRMLLTALYVVTLGLFLRRLRSVERRTAAYEKEIAKFGRGAEEHFQAESERMVQQVRLEVRRAIEQSSEEREPDSSYCALRTEMTEDDQKRIIVRFIENR